MIAVGLISYAWILAGTAPFSMKALLGVLLPGAVLGGIAYGHNSPPWHPSLTNLINPLIAPRPVKCAAIVIWLLAGWALVKR